MIPATEGKRLYRRLVEDVLNKHDLNVVDELIAPDYVEHSSGQAKQVGPEGFKAARRNRIAAFPDWKVVIEDMVEEGDKVVARATGSGTHQGEYKNISPTGKKITVGWIAIYRVAGGKLAEHWQTIDELSLLQQLGMKLNR